MKKQINLVILKLRNYRKFLILIDNADVDTILIYNKISFGEKKIINTLLVTKMIIIELIQCLKYFHK